MPAPIEFIPALPGRPATDQLLEVYRAELRREREAASPGEALWIAPTRRAQAVVQRKLLDNSLPVCVRPNIVTFDTFAERVLRDSPQAAAPLSTWLERSLLRRIVSRLVDLGRLTHFGPIAHTSGFLDVVASLIAELKRGETWPEHFETAARAGGSLPRDRELAAIYREYHNELVARNWYDFEGRFWSARQALRDGEWNSFANLELVVIDGFSDFTPTQYEILNLLAARAVRVIVTLPWEEPLVRSDLFAKPAAARGKLPSRESPLTANASSQLQVASSTPAGLRWIADNLFRNPREVRSAADAAGVEIVSAAGIVGEVQTVAARVKQRLLDGLAPDDVIVCVRDLGEYADVIDEVFSAAGIPFACDFARPWSRLPDAKTIVSLVHLELEDWPFRRLLDWLDAPCFVPGADWPLPATGKAGVRRAVSSELRRLKLHAGRQPILDCLGRLAQADTATDAASSPIGIAWAFLTKLDQVLSPLRREPERDFAGWTDVLAAVLRDCGCLSVVQGGDSQIRGEAAPSTRHAALSSLLDALFATARFERQFEPPRVLTLEDFLGELTDLLSHQQQRRSEDEAGRVRILDATQARHLDVPCLFVAGLTEGSFPRLWRDDCLYTEAERRRLNELGLELGHRAARLQDEMLLFFEVVTRAKRQLVLSYPAISSSGQPLSPSPYLLAVQELFDPAAITFHREERLDPVPPRDRVLTAADARVRAVQDVLDGDAALFRSLCDADGGRIEDRGTKSPGQFVECPSSILHPPTLPPPSSSIATACLGILAAAEMARKRFASRGFTDFEGRLAVPGNRRRLAARFGPEAEFSATQLERYAECPFRFFAQDVLGLSELESPELETSSLQRGVIVHEVLAKLHRELLTIKPDPETPDHRLQLHAPCGSDGSDALRVRIGRRFREILHEVLWRRPAPTELQAALREIEERVLGEWGAAYAEQWQNYQDAARAVWSQAPQPTQLEIGFGHPGGSPDDDPPAATAPSLVVGSGDEAIRIGGRIDRIDVGVVDGQRCFQVIDYKTGSAAAGRLDDVASGRDLQLALYTLAAERLALAGNNVRPFGLGYWLVRDKGFVFGLKGDSRKKVDQFDRLTPELWQSLQDALHDSVSRLARGIRTGSFPVINEDENCTSRCPFSTICRVNQIRPVAEALGKGREIQEAVED